MRKILGLPTPSLRDMHSFDVTQGTTITFNFGAGGIQPIKSSIVRFYTTLNQDIPVAQSIYNSTKPVHIIPDNLAGLENGQKYYITITVYSELNGNEGVSGLESAPSLPRELYCLPTPEFTLENVPDKIRTTQYEFKATFKKEQPQDNLNNIAEYQFVLYDSKNNIINRSGIYNNSGVEQTDKVTYILSHTFRGLKNDIEYYVVINAKTKTNMSLYSSTGLFCVLPSDVTVGRPTIKNDPCNGVIKISADKDVIAESLDKTKVNILMDYLDEQNKPHTYDFLSYDSLPWKHGYTFKSLYTQIDKNRSINSSLLPLNNIGKKLLPHVNPIEDLSKVGLTQFYGNTENTFSADKDGNVKGVNAIYPKMNFRTDNEKEALVRVGYYDDSVDNNIEPIEQHDSIVSSSTTQVDDIVPFQNSISMKAERLNLFKLDTYLEQGLQIQETTEPNHVITTITGTVEQFNTIPNLGLQFLPDTKYSFKFHTDKVDPNIGLAIEYNDGTKETYTNAQLNGQVVTSSLGTISKVYFTAPSKDYVFSISWDTAMLQDNIPCIYVYRYYDNEFNADEVLNRQFHESPEGIYSECLNFNALPAFNLTPDKTWKLDLDMKSNAHAECILDLVDNTGKHSETKVVFPSEQVGFHKILPANTVQLQLKINRLDDVPSDLYLTQVSLAPQDDPKANIMTTDIFLNCKLESNIDKTILTGNAKEWESLGKVELNNARQGEYAVYYDEDVVDNSAMRVRFHYVGEKHGTLVTGREFNTIFNQMEYSRTMSELVFDTRPIPQDKIANAVLVSTPNSENELYLYEDTTGCFKVASKIENCIIDANPDCSYMFERIRSGKINLSNFNATKVTNMSYMFRSTSLQGLYAPYSFETPNVRELVGTFEKAQSWESTFDISRFCEKLDTTNVTTMEKMFCNCDVNSLDLRGFITTNVISVKNMFGWACCLSRLQLPKPLDLTNAQHLQGMFRGCDVLQENIYFDLNKLYPKLDATHISDMFNGTSKRINGIYIYPMRQGSQVDIIDDMIATKGTGKVFRKEEDVVLGRSFTNTLAQLNPPPQQVKFERNFKPTTQPITELEATGGGAILVLTNESTGEYTVCPRFQGARLKANPDCSNMFNFKFLPNSPTNTITRIDFKGELDTSEVTNMQGMFANIPNLSTIDVSLLNTSKVTDMSFMFHNCPNLQRVQLTSPLSISGDRFSTTSVNTMEDMFSLCGRLENVDVTNPLDTRNVANMSRVFKGCPSLKNSGFTSLDTRSVNYLDEMFSGCVNLQGRLELNPEQLYNISYQDMFLNVSQNNTEDNPFIVTCGHKTVKDIGDDIVATKGQGKVMRLSIPVPFDPKKHYEQGELVSLGTLYRNNEKQPLPDGKDSDTTSLPTQNSIDFEIRNSEVNGTDNLQWYYAELNGKRLLVGDRHIARGISWNTLYGDDLEIGKPIFIDGAEYKLRCPYGGVRSSDADNEWDKIISNGIGIVGNSNLEWHWKGMRSWCCERDANYGSYRVRRGDTSSSFWESDLATDAKPNNAFRPVLELVPTATLLRGFDFYPLLPRDKMTKLTFTRTAIPQSKISTATLVTDLASEVKAYLYNTTGTEYAISPEIDNVTIMTSDSCQQMFVGCNALQILDLTNFNTINATDMSSMFGTCMALTKIIFGKDFNTSNVRSMANMFFFNFKHRTLDVSKFDTSNVTTMNGMFSTSKFTSLNLSNFDTRKVTSMTAMFSGCSELTTLDLTTFDISKVTNMDFLCSNCDALQTVKFNPDIKATKLVDARGMFCECHNLQTVNINQIFSTFRLTNIEKLFLNCYKLQGELDLDPVALEKLTQWDRAFENLARDASQPFTIKALRTSSHDIVDDIMSTKLNGKVFRADGSKHYGVRINYNNNNPETACTYLGDAKGRTPKDFAGSWRETPIFQNIRPCVLKDGVVQYYLQKDNLSLKDNGEPSDLTGADGDVMVEVPRMGYKLVTDAQRNNLEVWVTDGINQDGYSYLAHSLETEGDCDKIYYGAFQSDTDMHSRVGFKPVYELDMTVNRSKAQAFGKGYQLLSIYPAILIQCLYTILYKNLDSQTALGKGYTGGEWDYSGGDIEFAITGGTKLQPECYGTANDREQMKFLNIEDVWGNSNEIIDGLYIDGETDWTYCTTYKDFDLPPNQYMFKSPAGFVTPPSGHGSGYGGYTVKVQGNNLLGFLPVNDGLDGGSATTYFCDKQQIFNKYGMEMGGCIWNKEIEGMFYIGYMYFNEKNTHSDTRLIYKHQEQPNTQVATYAQNFALVAPMNVEEPTNWSPRRYFSQPDRTVKSIEFISNNSDLTRDISLRNIRIQPSLVNIYNFNAYKRTKLQLDSSTNTIIGKQYSFNLADNLPFDIKPNTQYSIMGIIQCETPTNVMTIEYTDGSVENVSLHSGVTAKTTHPFTATTQKNKTVKSISIKNNATNLSIKDLQIVKGTEFPTYSQYLNDFTDVQVDINGKTYTIPENGVIGQVDVTTKPLTIKLVSPLEHAGIRLNYAYNKIIDPNIPMRKTYVEGRQLEIDNVSKYPHEVEATIISSNLIKQPYTTKTTEINGITYTVKPTTGEILAVGTATEDSKFVLANETNPLRLLPDHEYAFGVQQNLVLENIVSLSIQRRQADDVSNDWVTLNTVMTQGDEKLFNINFQDVTATSGVHYQYKLVPRIRIEHLDGTISLIDGDGDVSNTILSHFKDIFLIDLSHSFRLKFGVSYSTMEQNQQIGVHNTIGNKYPIIISNSKLNYKSGGVRATVINKDYGDRDLTVDVDALGDNCNIYVPLDRAKMIQQREELLRFLTDKSPKILKDENGNAWIVMITGNPQVNFVEESYMSIANIDFTWVEIGDPNKEEDLRYSGLIGGTNKVAFSNVSDALIKEINKSVKSLINPTTMLFNKTYSGTIKQINSSGTVNIDIAGQKVNDVSLIGNSKLLEVEQQVKVLTWVVQTQVSSTATATQVVKYRVIVPTKPQGAVVSDETYLAYKRIGYQG